MKILVTGATGFLGSHIVEGLIGSRNEIIATCRKSSKRDELPFYQSIIWVETDQYGWENVIQSFAPEIIIHAAWSGVNSISRDNKDIQLSNISFTDQLLDLGKKCKIRKFISLGSQAEYGEFSEKINELYPVNPITSYGHVKLSVLKTVQEYCEKHHIEWYWLRVFSIFGERESDLWLIPKLINNILTNKKSMDFTPCEQEYAYLYVRDFANIVKKIVESVNPCPGVYNISSNSAIKLSKLLNMIRDKIDPNFKLNFGVIPYRSNQPMHIEGDMGKYIKQFGDIQLSDFDVSLNKTIEYYKNRIKYESI